MKPIGLAVVLCVASAVLGAQNAGLDPASILKPLSDSWPTYSGDMTGRRYSALTQVNQATVKYLTLGWTTRLVQGSGSGFGRGGFGGAPIIVGGEGAGLLRHFAGRLARGLHRLGDGFLGALGLFGGDLFGAVDSGGGRGVGGEAGDVGHGEAPRLEPN